MSKTRKTVWRSDEKLTQDIATGSGAMSVTFNPDGSAKVEEVRIHLSSASATAENLVIKHDHAEGAVYDVVHLTYDMDGVADLVFDTPIRMFEGDKLVLTWTNSDSRTWGLEIIYRRYKP